MKWILNRVQDDGLAAGATYGWNAPPGTAEATGLSNPSLLTDETPNTQSSTRMWGRTSLQTPLAGTPAGSLTEMKTHLPSVGLATSQLEPSVLRHRTT